MQTASVQRALNTCAKENLESRNSKYGTFVLLYRKCAIAAILCAFNVLCLQHSSGGSFLEDTITNRPYTRLLAGREQEEPLLGYDWIAGLMDNERSLGDIPDDCFEEVKEFRRQNKDACIGRYDLL